MAEIEENENWTEMFIQKIVERPAIYNKAMKKHTNKDFVSHLWTEVCEEMIPSWGEMSQVEKNLKDSENDLLINFSCSGNEAEILPLSNPFDLVAAQAENYDPFQLVFESAYCTSNNNNGNVATEEVCDRKADTSCINILDTHSMNSVLKGFQDQNGCPKNDSSNLVDIKMGNGIDNGNVDNWLRNNDATTRNQHNLNVEPGSMQNVDIKSSITSLNNLENTKSSLSSLDFSNEDTVKASISRRINKCMQRVLNGTLERKMAGRENATPMKPVSNANLSLPSSFVKRPENGLSKFNSSHQIGPVKLACSPSTTPFKGNILDVSPINLDDSFELQQTRGSNDFNRGYFFSTSGSESSAPSEIKQKHADIYNSDLEDDVFNDCVFEEANKLANLCKEMAINESFKVNNRLDSTDNKVDDPVDLLSMHVTWDPVDSSDEEADMLRNLSSLSLKGSRNVKEPPKKKIEFSEAVIQYKLRRSLDLNLSSGSLPTKPADSINTSQMKRSNSFNGTDSVNIKHEALKETKQPLAVTESFIEKQTRGGRIDQEIVTQKLKAVKPQAETKKKGPLRAIMPLQSMTRSNLLKGIRKVASPKRNHQISTQSLLSTPKRKQNKQASNKPTASSTPLKGLSPRTSPSVSPILPAKGKSTGPLQRHNSMDSANLQQNKSQQKLRTSSWSSIPSEKEIISQNRFNLSDEVKKKSIGVSQLPRIKSASALHSRNGNKKLVPLLPQPLTMTALKMSDNLFPKQKPVGKENILPA